MTSRTLSDLPREVQNHIEEIKADWANVAAKRGRVVYIQVLNLDGLNDGEHSVVFSRIMSEVEAEFRTDIGRALQGAPTWVVNPIIEAAVDGLHAGYSAFAALDNGGQNVE